MRALGPVMAIVAVVLIGAAALCLFDSDQEGEFCISALAAMGGLLPAISLALTERFRPALVPAYRRYPPDLPAPPPKA